MKFITEGHKLKSICPECDKITSVTFRYRPYKTDSEIKIPDVLQGFCDECDKRILIPPQSIPKIKPYYAAQNVTQEFKFPPVIEDILLNIGNRIGLEKPDAFKSLLRFYLLNQPGKRWLKKDALPELGPARGRLSVRIDEGTDEALKEIAKKLGLNKTQFIAAMLWDAKERLLENTAEAKEFRSETKLFSAIRREAA
jgi:hypothetical protein